MAQYLGDRLVAADDVILGVPVEVHEAPDDILAEVLVGPGAPPRSATLGHLCPPFPGPETGSSEHTAQGASRRGRQVYPSRVEHAISTFHDTTDTVQIAQWDRDHAVLLRRPVALTSTNWCHVQVCELCSHVLKMRLAGHI